MKEAEFQRQVIELAQLFGWRVGHFRPAKTARGWRTPVAADGAGFPDLCLAKPGQRPFFAELKSERGRLSQAQRDWLAALGPEYSAVWRPADWDNIERMIRGGKPC